MHKFYRDGYKNSGDLNMTDKSFAPPSKEIEWLVQPHEGEHGFYKHEVGSHISHEITMRRARGVAVVAQTAFFARQLGARALGLSPEHVQVIPCETTRADVLALTMAVKIALKTTEEIIQRCQNGREGPTNGGS